MSCYTDFLVSFFNNAACQMWFGSTDLSYTENSLEHEGKKTPKQPGQTALFSLTAETLNRTYLDQVQRL